MALKQTHPVRDLLNREAPGFVGIVEVGGVVGNFVGQIDELCFERRTLIEDVLVKLRMLPGSVIVRVLNDALADFKCQIQPAESGITQFEIFDDSERVQIVIEGKPVLAHGGVERFFSRVAKRRVAEVVNQGERLRQIGVQAKLHGDGARDLRDLNGVSQPVAEMIGVAAGENLRLRFQAAKGAGMDDTVTVALKVVAVGMRWLGMAASAGVFYAHRIVGEHGESLAFFILIRTAKAFRNRGKPTLSHATGAALPQLSGSRGRWRKPCASSHARLRRSQTSCGWRHRCHLYHEGEAARIAESRASGSLSMTNWWAACLSQTRWACS